MKKSLSVIFLALPLYVPSALGQFEKFKPQPKPKKAVEKSQSGVKASLPRREEADDVFGRQTGIKSVKGKQRDKHFVNLNPETAFGPEVVKNFDHPETSLKDLTKFMQKLTGINLIIDKELKGKVSILSPSPITIGDAWKAYLTALNANNYSLVKSGAFYKIVSTRDIRYTPTKIYTGNYTPRTENYVMRILPLKNINSSEVMRSFRSFMTRHGRITEIKQTNTLIIQDTGTNINRLAHLIKFIDVPGHEERLQIIKVRHSSAQEIATLLDKILSSSGGGKTRVRGRRRNRRSGGSGNISKIIADPRTNTIIAMANAEGASRLRLLIEKLDSKVAASMGGKIHVYYLNHGSAKTLAETLNSLVSSSRGKRRRGRSDGPGSIFRKSREGSLFSDSVRITADEDNNAIVVTASPTDYLTVKEVIRKLDIPRDQVYVEGMIMETRVSRDRGFGISVVGAYGSGGAQKAGFSDDKGAGLLSLLTNQITNLGGLFAGVGLGKKIEFDPGTGKKITVNSVNGLIKAIASNSNSNVLATPQILALDNSEAVFEVGESFPVPKETIANNGSTSNSIEQHKVGLTLKITPQINKVTRFIKLKIQQKLDNFRPLPEGHQSAGIATVNRSTETTVVVRDRDTIAMGGLMRDRENSKESKVPLLGDIPVLGWLFKHTSKATEKVNLLFFLTPRILANYQKSAARTMRDVINRRAAHLKDIQGESDSFISTAKALYDKSKKQEEAPLYDTSERKIYQDQNADPGEGNPPEELEEEPVNDDWQDGGEQARVKIPNYKTIAQEVNRTKSGQEKEER